MQYTRFIGTWSLDSTGLPDLHAFVPVNAPGSLGTLGLPDSTRSETGEPPT